MKIIVITLNDTVSQVEYKKLIRQALIAGGIVKEYQCKDQIEMEIKS